MATQKQTQEQTPKHTVIKDVEQMNEEMISIPASLLVHTKSYHELLAGERLEIVQNIETSTKNLLADLIDCVTELKRHETREVSLTIKTDDQYQPRLIVKTYLVKKVAHNRR